MKHTQITSIIPIERASEELIETLIKLGLLYIGNDNQLHAIDNEKIPQSR